MLSHSPASFSQRASSKHHLDAFAMRSSALGRALSRLAGPRLTKHGEHPFALALLGHRWLSQSTVTAAAAANSDAPAVLLVESPAKAKKIQEYLGPGFHVLASYGHIRDLPAKNGSVRPDEGFQMAWELSDGASARVKEIAATVAAAPRVYLATDPDREGEAISWHLVEELRGRGALSDGGPVPQRVTFTEVTKAAVEAALAAPREVSAPLVEAYMARRALDYLFGFNLSPLLWRKLPGARSAGRVQSVALRLVADREAEIEAFNPQKYWTIHARAALPSGGAVLATLTAVDGKAPPSPGFLDEAQAQAIRDRVEAAAFAIAAVSRRESARSPPPPFTTSTLQQEANKRLGWGASRTMQYAQKLYEAGFITYMRTDGVNVAPTAVQALRAAAAATHGPAYVPDTSRFYSSKSKNAQEAHEAIRPTDPTRAPAALTAEGMEAVQLYSLIWARALASQMASARVQSVGVDFLSEDGTLKLRSTAAHTVFPGYLAAYGGVVGRSRDAQLVAEGGEEEDEDGTSARAQRGVLSGEQAAVALAALAEGESADLKKAEAAPHETRPPGRFTEGTLVKALEEAGVGRPSTYAPTLKLLQSRRYLRKEGRALHAEPLGRVLSSFLIRYFPTYVDPGFTSAMEANLDEISAGRQAWKELLGEFWGPFSARVSELQSLSGTEVLDALNEELQVLLFGLSGPENDGEEGKLPPGRVCPSCGSALSLKLSHRGGPFVGCSTYPTCTFARPMAAADDFKDAEGAANGDEGALSGLELAEKYGMRGSVRLLGTDPRGKEIFARQGPYGPYLQLGTDTDPEMRRAPLPKNQHLRSVRLDYALSMLALPRTLGDHPVTGIQVTVRNGKFGPYVAAGTTLRSLPKELDPISVTLEEAVALIEVADEAAKKKEARKAAKVKAKGAGDSLTAPPMRRGRQKKQKGEGEEKAKGKDKAGDDATEAIKSPRARSAFMFFMQDQTSNYYGMPARERMKAMGEAWRALPDDARGPYDAKALADKQRVVAERAGLVGPGTAEWEGMGEQARAEVMEKLKGRPGVLALAQGKSPELKRPPSSFTLFTKDYAAQLRESAGKEGAPKVDRADFMKAVSGRWREMSAAEKRVYEDRAKEEQQRYEKQRAKLIKSSLEIK